MAQLRIFRGLLPQHMALTSFISTRDNLCNTLPLSSLGAFEYSEYAVC